MVLARKLVAPNGDFLGVVAAQVSLRSFEKFFTFVSNGENSAYVLFRDDGMLLLRYPRVVSLIGTVRASALKALTTRDSAVIRFAGRQDGKDRLLAAQRVQDFPLYVAAAVQEDAILSNWRKQTTVPFAVTSLLTLIIAIVVFLIAQQRAREQKRSEQNLALQKERLDTAVNNMTQGLLLFDAKGKIVICNKRYIAMYGLSAEVVRPGCTLRELIVHRKERGSFDGDVDEYCCLIERYLAQERITEFRSKPPTDTPSRSSTSRSKTAAGSLPTKTSPKGRWRRSNAIAIGGSSISFSKTCRFRFSSRKWPGGASYR